MGVPCAGSLPCRSGCALVIFTLTLRSCRSLSMREAHAPIAEGGVMPSAFAVGQHVSMVGPRSAITP